MPHASGKTTVASQPAVAPRTTKWQRSSEMTSPAAVVRASNCWGTTCGAPLAPAAQGHTKRLPAGEHAPAAGPQASSNGTHRMEVTKPSHLTLRRFPGAAPARLVHSKSFCAAGKRGQRKFSVKCPLVPRGSSGSLCRRGMPSSEVERTPQSPASGRLRTVSCSAH